MVYFNMFAQNHPMLIPKMKQWANKESNFSKPSKTTTEHISVKGNTFE